MLAVLPAGYGKSVIYQILPDVFDIMLGTEKSVVLVISPLNALTQDQITKLKDRGISCSLIVTCPYFLIASTIFSLVAISPNKSTLLRLTIYALIILKIIIPFLYKYDIGKAMHLKLGVHCTQECKSQEQILNELLQGQIS